MTDLDSDIPGVLRREFRVSAPSRLGLAVSGGGDSMALLYAAAQAFAESSTNLFAVTVDHGLREGTAGEIALVAKAARRLNLPHDVLRWEGWDGHGNLQEQARTARYKLMARWAKQNEIAVLALAHTADDQAETVLMRLARASGVDGLSGIPRRRIVDGLTLVRPFLDISRAELRDYLTKNSVSWVEDPSNEDTRFERIRIRKAANFLAELGLTPTALSEVAQNMKSAREALDWYTFVAARDIVHLEGGNVIFDQRQFRVLPEEIARRLVERALRWIAGGPYPPRRNAVRDAIGAARLGKTTTLHGCIVTAYQGQIWICREYNAIKDEESPLSEVWDGRWRLTAQKRLPEHWRVRPLGRVGLRQCGDWRATGRPFAALIASPAVWDGERVVAAPQAGLNGIIQVELIGGGEDFFASILSH